jgi:hypothetical protein
MTLRKALLHTAAVLALTQISLTAQAQAQARDPLDKRDPVTPQAVLKDIIREEDVTLLFKHLRESMAAAARGEEAQESEALQRRAEQIQRDLAARGSVLMGALLTAVEVEAKRALRELLRETPPRATPGGI